MLPVVAVLGVGGADGFSGTAEWLPPLVACMLPAAVLVGDWWEGWPGSRTRHPGLINVAVAAAIGIVVYLLSSYLLPGKGVVPAIAFVAFVEISVVSEKRPFHRLPRIIGGVVGLAGAWSISALIVTLSPWPSDGLLALTATIGATQIVVMAVLDGGPAKSIAPTAVRVLLMNAVCLGAGACVYRLGVWSIGGAGLWTALMASVTSSAIAASWLPRPEPGRMSRRNAIRRRLQTTTAFSGFGAIVVVLARQVATPAEVATVTLWLTYLWAGAVGLTVVSYSMLFGWWWPAGKTTRLTTALEP